MSQGSQQVTPPRKCKRSVEGLEWVQRASRSPHTQSLRGLSPAQKAGIRFENRVSRKLKAAAVSRDIQASSSTHTPSSRIWFEAGPWLEYCDLGGRGFAQPDQLIWCTGPEAQVYWALVYECKLSWVPSARDELQQLYLPLVEAWLAPATLLGVEVFQQPNGWVGRSIRKWDEPLAARDEADLFAWHLMRP